MAAPMDEEENRRKVLFQAISLILQPSSSKVTLSTNDELLETVLKGNLQVFEEFLAQNSALKAQFQAVKLKTSFADEQNGTTRQRYSQMCLILLSLVKQSIQQQKKNAQASSEMLSSNTATEILPSSKPTSEASAPELPPGSLSVQQEKAVSAALQFVIVLGLCPYLAPGVGIPVSKRLGPGHILLASADDLTSDLSHVKRIKQILPVLHLLVDFMKEPVLRDIMVANYLVDILTALIQVRYCANIMIREKSGSSTHLDSVSQALEGSQKKDFENSSGYPQENAFAKDVASTNSCAASDLPQSTWDNFLLNENWSIESVTGFCTAELNRLLQSINVPLLLKALLMLSASQKSNPGSSVSSPLWYRRSIAIILRDLIMVAPNVQLLILELLGDISGDSTSVHEYQKCKAVAQVISRCPVTPKNVEHFYFSVSQQLIHILQTNSQSLSPLVVRAVGGAIQELTNQQPALMHRVCLNQVKAPLLKLSEVAPSEQREGSVWLSEAALTSCLDCLYRLYVIGQEPQSPLMSTLSDVVGIIFDLLVFSHEGVTSVKSIGCALMKSYISDLTAEEGTRCLIGLLTRDATQLRVSSNVRLASGPSGGIQAVISSQTSLNPDQWTSVVDITMDIVQGLDTLVAQLFLQLLQKLTDFVTSETDNITVVLPPHVLSASEREAKMSELGQKIVLVSLLASLGEKFGSELIKSGHQILVFVKATLERSLKISQSTSDDITSAFEWETVTMAMGLLTAVLGGALELESEDKHLLDSLLPLLTSLSEDQRVEPVVKEMADDLRVSVATRGLVSMELSKSKKSTEPSTQKKSSDKKKPLIEVLSDSEHQGSEPKPTSKLEQALQELCDPLVPVRGHGLISLARMVEDQDPETKDKHNVLLKVFLENLGHSDSYIYLAAVNGLSALSDCYPDQVIPLLTSEFRSKCKGQESEITLKVGEAVVKATKRLGELTPKFSDHLLPALLCGCRHGDHLVRASSLSGLADTCRLMRFAVGGFVHELMTCCRDVLSSDPHPEPRQAAAMTLTLLLQGLGKEALQTLSDVLRDLYRTLRHSLTFDPDDKVKVHCNLALSELDDIMREALFAPLELKKKITILGYQ